MNAIKNMKKFADDFRIQRATFIENMKGEFKDAVNEVFEKNPAIVTLTWTQYTPYFNDGDPCVFQVNDMYFSNADRDDLSAYGEYEGEDEEKFSEGVWGLRRASKEGIDIKTLEEFESVFSNMDNILEDMFGDGVSVTVTKEGISVDEYDHD